MKLSTVLSFAALSATATLAFPLSPFRGLRARTDLEERDMYAPAPVRRSDVASSAEPTATESSSTESTAGSSHTASATLTSSASEATSTASESSSSSSDDSTDTWLYSTITQNGSMTTPPASTRTLDPTTETASTTTQTEAPQSTSSDVSRNNGNHNNNNDNVNVDISQQVIIRIKEVIRIREVVVVERPVLVAVQVNIKVRQTIIVNQIRNVFINRFDNWDQNVVDQLGLVISQQFDILTRSHNSGFDDLSNDQYNRFVSKFISQFQVFQSFQLVDVQQFVTVLRGFGVNELATFFGRSDSLFSQDTFNRFNVNNDFKVFVQQLTVIVQAVSVDSFNSDDLFGLGSGSLVAAGSIQV